MNDFETKICRKCRKQHNDEFKTCDSCRVKEKVYRDSKHKLAYSVEDSGIESYNSEVFVSSNIDVDEYNSLTEDFINKENINKITKPNELIFNGFYIKDKITQEESLDFIHPFTCKLFGSRGSGKTTWLINYLNFIELNNLNNFVNIFFITNSSNQKLFELLKCNVTFITLKEFNLKVYKDNTLVILDDMMLDVKDNPMIEQIYSRGRHCNISIFSLEQHSCYSNNVERVNTDYFLLFKFNDGINLDYFRKKFCSEVEDIVFKKINLYCLKSGLPLIISMNSKKYKLRLNFNSVIKYDEENFSIKDIIEKPKEIKNEVKIKKKKKNKLKYIKYGVWFLTSPIWIPYYILKGIVDN